jgi:restriction endonuclease S subunit
VQPAGKINDIFEEIVNLTLGRPEQKRVRKKLFDPILSRFVKLKAS